MAIGSKKKSSTKTEGKGKRKKKGGGLLGLVKKATKKKTSGGSSNPTIRIEEEKLAKAVKRLSKNLVKSKDMAGEIKADKALLLKEFDSQRVAYCQSIKKAVTTLRLSMEDDSGEAYSLSVTQTSRYSPLSIEEREEAIEEIEEEFEIDAEDAEEEFDKRFVKTVEISFEKDQLRDGDTIAQIESLLEENPWLGSLLKVNQTYTPTKSFHEARVTDKEEGRLYKTLKDAKLMEPYAAGFKS